jgi:DNA-binding NarL/FixJ family response regulator
MTTIILADDHGIVRDGLRALLENHPGMQVIGEAATGAEAVRLAVELNPDVMLLDISMPELNGLDAARQIAVACPTVRLIFLSMFGTPEHVRSALQIGVQGYLLKDSAGQEVLQAVMAVAGGQRYLSQSITNTLVSDYLQVSSQAAEPDPLENLSPREREILVRVVEGQSSAEIGRALFLSPKTVETYRSRLMQKLDVTDVPSLVKFAIQHGLTGL